MSRDSQRPWQGHLRIGDDWAAWSGAVGDAQPHRHFAAQCVLAESAHVFLPDGHELASSCVLIEPLAMHRLLPVNDATLVFLEPRPQADHALPDDLRELLQKQAAIDHVVIAAAGRVPTFWSTWLATPASMSDLAASEWRSRVREHIDAALGEGNVALAPIATAMGLSGERFRHVFAERVGMAFRRFVLWRRLRCAVVATQQGANATEAAHRAGFADAAHFSRTLKVTFGVTAGRSLLA